MKDRTKGIKAAWSYLPKSVRWRFCRTCGDRITKGSCTCDTEKSE